MAGRSNRSDQRTPQRAAMDAARRGLNKLQPDPSRLDPNMSYKWAAAKVAGAENTLAMAEDERFGWQPVPPENHPELTGKNYKRTDAIEIGGSVLMWRPKALTEEANQYNLEEARRIFEHQMARVTTSGYRVNQMDRRIGSEPGISEFTFDGE